MQTFKLSYFGWTATFQTETSDATAIRAKANAMVVAQHGQNPPGAIRYVEPGTPFPAYVPVQVWEGETQGWQPYL